VQTGKDTAGPTVFSLWFPFLTWQLQEYLRRMMYTRGDVFNALVNSTLANGLRIGLLIYWVSQGSLTGISGLDAIAWGSLVALLPGIWQTRAHWSRMFDPLLPALKRNWQFGRWVMGGLFASWLSVEFYPVLTAGMVSFAAAGAYRALQNLVAPVHVLLRATDTFLTPRAAKVYHQSGMRGLWRVLRLTYFFTGIPILGVLAAAIIMPAPILQLLYGDTYLEYSNAMVLMAIFYMLLFAYWPLQTAFKAIHISRPIFTANLIAILGMFTIGIWAILTWGVYGTISGQILNALIVTVILWGTWIKITRSPKHA
jgi:O-antigen/teichoic acid export membrane protein